MLTHHQILTYKIYKIILLFLQHIWLILVIIFPFIYLNFYLPLLLVDQQIEFVFTEKDNIIYLVFLSYYIHFFSFIFSKLVSIQYPYLTFISIFIFLLHKIYNFLKNI